MFSHTSPGVTVRFFAAVLLAIFIFGLVPAQAFAEHYEDLEISGWVPYWRAKEGAKDARSHIKDLDTVYPFAYVIRQDGTIKDLADLKDREWQRLFRAARSRDVEIIPTVMASDGVLIHTILSNPKLREKHVEAIASMVKKGKYDGVDIDYESKKAETKDYYSLFLKELKDELGSKLLTCTVEARTPPSSLYREVPAVIQYANDYNAIGKYCDRVEIMAYDQQRADIKLNSEKAGQPYMPVSDVDWVRKVVELAIQTIPKGKIILGIPSYGHHYEVTVAPNWYRDYRRIGALNVPDILDIADDYNVTPSRNRAGEMSFTYIPKSSDLKLSKSLKIPKDTPKGNIVAARALAYANKTGETVKFNMAWYSDAEAMLDKVDLAREYDLRGVAFFKIDGEEDHDIWDLLEE